MPSLVNNLPALGLGCWPMAGPMYAPDGKSLGYSNSNDAESVKAIHAALANGISVFDTAVAYGAGHSERLLGQALKGQTQARVITKIGIGIDEQTKALSFDTYTPEQVAGDISQSLARLQRETIDLLLLHINSCPVDQAELLFDEMDKACEQGKIRGYGWSTDFASSAKAVTSRSGFVAVEYAMNVLIDAPNMQALTQSSGISSLIRSPLAMGLLSGKYSSKTTMLSDDVRASDEGWMQYFVNGKPNPLFMQRYNAIEELLRTDGRSTIQGALGWLWGKYDRHIPVPGARTVKQVEELAKALEFGALPPAVMLEIDSLIERNHAVDEEDRER